MVTFDVTDRNIHRESGKQALSFCMEKYPRTLYIRFNKRFITDGTELIVNNDSLQFNKNYNLEATSMIYVIYLKTYTLKKICCRIQF